MHEFISLPPGNSKAPKKCLALSAKLRKLWNFSKTFFQEFKLWLQMLRSAFKQTLAVQRMEYVCNHEVKRLLCKPPFNNNEANSLK